MDIIKYIFSYFILFAGGLTFALSIAMLINLYCFTFLRNKFKSFYYYFCNIIAFIITGLVIGLVWGYTNGSILTIVLEFMLLVGVTLSTNEPLLSKFYEENIKYDKDKAISKLIRNNADFCHLRSVIVWTFYVIAVVVNSLSKLGMFEITDLELKFIFESAECSAIMLLAITTLIAVIKKRKNIKNATNKKDELK